MTDQQQPSFLNITRSKRFYYEVLPNNEQTLMGCLIRVLKN